MTDNRIELPQGTLDFFDPRAKNYELTRKGRAHLEAKTAAWRRVSAAIGVVLETA